MSETSSYRGGEIPYHDEMTPAYVDENGDFVPEMTHRVSGHPNPWVAARINDQELRDEHPEVAAPPDAEVVTDPIASVGHISIPSSVRAQVNRLPGGTYDPSQSTRAARRALDARFAEQKARSRRHN